MIRSIHFVQQMQSRTIATYPEFLRANGEIVVQAKGIAWMKYQHALIPAAAMPVHTDLTREEALRAIREASALFLRYTTGPFESETNWWHVVCREYDMKQLSGNTRSKIRRGLKRMQISQVDPVWLAEHGYDCHVISYRRYKNAKPLSRTAFESFFQSMQGLPMFEAWIAVRDGVLQGYVLCLREANGVFIHTFDVTAGGLSDYAGYALIHSILEKYINQEGLPVSNGCRSVSHTTNMQSFLMNFGFEKVYGKLHVVYRPSLGLLVRLLFPIRRVFDILSGFPGVHRVWVLLYQEEIARG